MTNKPTVAIIGAGPAGLSAAYELTRHQALPLVLEKGDRVGGIARTENHRGFLFDIGGHRFFSKIERINALWHDMLGEDFVPVARLSRIYYRGRFFNYPLEFFNTIGNLGALESVLIPLSYFKAQFRPHPREENLEQWVTNRFGRRLYETFFKSYTEKVWGVPCHQIRADWAAQRIKGLSLVAAVSAAVFGNNKAKSLIDAFHYPVRGPGMMWERFAQAVTEGGGEVLLGAEAIRLAHDRGRVRRIFWQGPTAAGQRDVDHVISTIPLPHLVGRLDPPAPVEVAEAAAKLKFRAFIIVVLILDKPDLFPDQWIYIHSPDVRVGRIQNFRNWSAAMVPDPRRSSIGMEYFCNAGDALWQTPDATLVQTAADELASLGLARTADVVDSFVVRQPHAYPLYDPDYAEHLGVVRRYLDTFDNLQTIGRNGMHRYNNMDHSMQTGLLAAQNVLGARHDLLQVNDDEDYLEEDTAERRAVRLSKAIVRKEFARLDKLAFATAVGCAAGLTLFLATIWLVVKGGPRPGATLQLLAQYFVGYTVSYRGALVAFAYSFWWGFLFGWLFAYLRNLLVALFAYNMKKRAAMMSLKDFFDQM